MATRSKAERTVVDSVAGSVGNMERRASAGDRSARAKFAIVLLAVLLGVTVLLSLASGASDASALAVARDWLFPSMSDGSPLSERDRIIVYDIRLPRVVLGVLIGSALAVSGAVMQGLFRNPLADPGLVGVSAGAGLGAIVVIVLGGTMLGPLLAILDIYTLPLAAFAGGLATTLILYRVATRRGQTSIATMLLAGIALGAMAGAFSGIMVYLADDRQLRDLTFWGLGSLAGATWTKIAAAGPIIALALIASPFLARGLNALALGEAAAHHLGIPVQRFKNVAIVSVAAATGASVAVSGGIGFVGIVVPHLLRLLIGPDNRYLLPASALLGASMLLLADAISRIIVAPAELPIGIITAAVGGPFFLWILLRKRGLLDL
ncbi:FecCD family ABC transporter permease [Mesorhizobium soli]|uniref:Iron ABC transporter n=1 Tax=Pseudaminobacter soli (ex Li et al. 2025) TaxID=1295366 RepID=A0A2P7SB41_9HYPH|nr:iron ABC transporter [Mesorhizobium soli]